MCWLFRKLKGQRWLKNWLIKYYYFYEIEQEEHHACSFAHKWKILHCLLWIVSYFRFSYLERTIINVLQPHQQVDYLILFVVGMWTISRATYSCMLNEVVHWIPCPLALTLWRFFSSKFFDLILKSFQDEKWLLEAIKFCMPSQLLVPAYLCIF